MAGVARARVAGFASLHEYQVYRWKSIWYCSPFVVYTSTRRQDGYYRYFIERMETTLIH